MKIKIKNSTVVFQTTEFVYFDELLKNVNIGGGYISQETDSSASWENNTFSIDGKKNVALNYPLVVGRKYLFGFKATMYTILKTTSPSNTNGSIIINTETSTAPRTAIFTAVSDIFNYPSVQRTASTGQETIKLYMYDITGYDDSLFANLTYDDLASGRIRIVKPVEE